MSVGDMTSRPQHVVTLLTRPGCHLCEVAREVVERVVADTGARLDEQDITADDELLARYRDLIPVILVDGRQHDYWRVEESRLRAALSSG